MTLLLDPPKKFSWQWLGWLFLLALVVVIVNFPEWELRYRTSKVVKKPEPSKYHVVTREIKKREAEKNTFHSRIFQLPFTQEGATGGRSPEELVLRFDQAAEIWGIAASVDCWKSTRLVEFAGGINQKPAYQNEGDKDILFHVSFATNNTAGKIDEQFWFPKPFIVLPEDSINIGAWIQNISPDRQAVSPEFIVYYSWVK